MGVNGQSNEGKEELVIYTGAFRLSCLPLFNAGRAKTEQKKQRAHVQAWNKRVTRASLECHGNQTASCLTCGRDQRLGHSSTVYP